MSLTEYFNHPLSAQVTLLWTQRMIAIAVCLQTLEYLQIRKSCSAQGVWTWALLKADFEILPRWLQTTASVLLSDRNFSVGIWLRLAAAIGVIFFPNPLLFGFLLLSSVLISLRWRGSFNGGSDFMTLIVLSAVWIASLFADHSTVVIGCLWYIALQSTASYLLSGLIKLRTRNWRNGTALQVFLRHPGYAIPHTIQRRAESRPMMLMASWVVIAFECSFPIIFWEPRLALPYLAMGLCFHLVNFYIFGLNRFVWAWASTYPAIYFCSQYHF